MKRVTRILFCALFSSIFIAPVSNAASDTTLLTICTSLRTDYQLISASGKCNERIYEKSTWYEPGMAPRGTLGSKTVSITLCTSKSRSNLRTLAKEGRSCNRAYQTQSIFQRPLGPPAAPELISLIADILGTALITIKAPLEDGGARIRSYEVIEVGSTTLANKVLATITTSFPIKAQQSTKISGLTPSQSYRFAIGATNAIGASPLSQSSAVFLAPTLPGAPSITSAVAPIPSPSPSSSAPALAAPAFTLSSSSETRTVNTAATGFTISSTGGAIASFAISTTPAGMSFSTSTGALTGTPTTVAGATAYTVTATNATGSTTQTFTLTVSPGAATKAMMTTQPAGAVSGSAFTTQPVVRVTDSGDNTVTTFTGNVVASIASGTGTLSGTTTAAAVAGIATFTNLVITGTAGNFTLTFTPVSLTAVTSSSFALAAGAATKVAITRASVGTTDNVAFTTQPQITIQDASGNTVSSSAVVTATISAGSLIGTDTATASSGVATFTGLGIDGTNGTTYTITYTASGLTVATATVTLVALTCATGGTCIVGDTGPGGGKVFYVAASNFTSTGSTCNTTCRYLEAAPTSGTNAWTDAAYNWSGNTTVQIGATAAGTAIGTGYANTLAIVGQLSGGNTAGKAGTIARAYGGPNNLSDWYLPSKVELNQMCKWARGVAWVSDDVVCTGGTINTGSGTSGFVEGYYWSSTERDTYHAWLQTFANGTQPTSLKDSTSYVRPVRAF